MKKPYKNKRVICISEFDGNTDIIGKTGFILKKATRTEDCYYIQFDEEIDQGHDAQGSGRNHHCWYMSEDSFIVIDQFPIVNDSIILENNTYKIQEINFGEGIFITDLGILKLKEIEKGYKLISRKNLL